MRVKWLEYKTLCYLAAYCVEAAQPKPALGGIILKVYAPGLSPNHEAIAKADLIRKGEGK